MTDRASEPTLTEIRDFYDRFSLERMIGYRLHGNRRLEVAKKRILPLLRPRDRVLDLGCGIGIVAEAIGRHIPRGQVLGVDLSQQNIAYARKTVRVPNVRFEVQKAQAPLSGLRHFLGGLADVAVLTDVVEHIPEADRPALFREIRKVCTSRATVVLTYPSPQYQTYLQNEKPSELQIIDNRIELGQLMEEAGRSGWHLRHFSLEDVWLQNQYCHAVFCTDVSLRPLEIGFGGMASVFLARLHAVVERRVFVPLRRRRYDRKM